METIVEELINFVFHVSNEVPQKPGEPMNTLPVHTSYVRSSPSLQRIGFMSRHPVNYLSTSPPWVVHEDRTAENLRKNLLQKG
jgi:hypothetical protein